MRIAQFTESYKPVINGVAVAMDLLLEEFRQRHEVSVFAPRFSGYRDEAPEGVRIHRFPSYITPVEREYPIAYPVAPELGARFREAQPEVVHTHSPFTLGQLGRRWARRAGVPVVTTYHTLYVEYAHYAPLLPQPLSRWGLRELSRRYCESCDAVVVPTSPIREVLLEYGVRTPIHVIPTGLRLKPPMPRDPEVRRRWGIPDEAVLTMYAGRLAREKNLPLLFESFARTARENPGAWLLVAGSGPVEAEARQLAARTGVGERVVLPGFVAPEEMPGVYAAADLFLFTSLTDTQGLVLTEAKAAGLPVVSVNAYGPGVVVRNEVDGYLREPDPDALAAALSRLVREPDRRARMRENALREAQHFSIEATASAYEALYAELVAQRR